MPSLLGLLRRITGLAKELGRRALNLQKTNWNFRKLVILAGESGDRNRWETGGMGLLTQWGID